MCVCLFDLLVHVVDSGMKNKLTVYSHYNTCCCAVLFFFFLGGGGGGRGGVGGRIELECCHFIAF